MTCFVLRTFVGIDSLERTNKGLWVPTICRSFTKSSTIQPTYNDKLLLYSLFKQAVHGDVKNLSISRPGIFDMLGRAKWDAWKARQGLSSIEAKKLYIECVLNILRSHRASLEARSLMEMLSSYEAYSCMTDEFSETDDSEDLDHINLQQKTIYDVPSSTIQQTRRITEKHQEDDDELSDDHLSKSERHQHDSEDDLNSEDDLRSSGLGPYVTTSQLPDPVDSPESQIFPPTSPSTQATTGSGRLSESKGVDPSSISPKDGSSSLVHLPSRSKERGLLLDQLSDGLGASERRFTDAQVQRLVQEEESPLLNSPHHHDGSNPSSSSHSTPPPLPSLIHKSSSEKAPQIRDKFTNNHDLNQSIKNFENLVSKFDSQLQLFKELVSLSTTINATNKQPTPLPPLPPPPSSPSFSGRRFVRSLFRYRWIQSLDFAFSFKHLVLDFSIFYILFKFYHFFKKKKENQQSPHHPFK